MDANDYEELIILLEFKTGVDVGRLSKRYKKKTSEINDIIRRKLDELQKYRPLARR